MNQAGEAMTAEALILEMKRLEAQPCSACAVLLCAHQVLMNIALGFKHRPRCLSCLANALDSNALSFRDSLIEYLQQRKCHQKAWAWANEHEGVASIENAACLQLPNIQAVMSHRQSQLPGNPDMSAPGAKENGNAHLRDISHEAIAAEWDAGEMSCGDFVLELRHRLQALRPGEIIKIYAHDPGARQDLPAWSRLTGNFLVRAEHPTYWIKRKE